MSKPFMIAGAAALLACVASPVIASEPNRGEAGAAVAKADPAKPAARIRYCVIDTPIGSHIRKKVCRTRDEWLKRGVDPTEE